MKGLKDKILTTVPLNVASKLYFFKNGKKTVETELIRNIKFPLTIRSNDALWTDRLSKPKGHEFGICDFLQKNIKSGDSFFDVGACYGVFSALVANLKDNISIHSFEPEIANFLFLIENASLNRKDSDWTINRKYVSNKSDTSSVSLDDYCEMKSIVPTIMKMDIDGAEYNALRGANKLISKKQTHFLIEIHPQFLQNYGFHYQQVLDLFDDDYVMFVLPNIREMEESPWSKDLSIIENDYNPYIYVAPKNISLLS